MLEIFYTSQYDNNTAVINGEKKYSYKELKGLIANQIIYLRNKKENIVLLSGDNFCFIINFFASLFCKKNIYLLTDRNRLSSLNFEYDIIGQTENKFYYNFKFPEINPNDIVINFYTSGSSGNPKTIQKSLFNLIEEGQDLGKEFNIGNNKNVLSTTTMCHLFGMTFHLFFPLCNGLIINTTPIAYPENINSDNSILVSTPAFLGTKIKHNLDFTVNPEYIISAGSKLNEKVFESLEKESKIIEIYGSTETGVIAYKTKHNEKFNVFPNVSIKINADSVEITSKYVFGGKNTINDKIDITNGKLTIANRTDRLFKIYEKRVSAEELESKLNMHEFVDGSYITNSDNKLVCLCALSDKGREYLLNNNIYPITRDLKLYMLKFSEIIPQKWKFIDQIPMNKVGKIKKHFIEHLFNLNLSLPIIIDRIETEDTITYKLFFYKNCNFFNGHFPEFKLVPGVVQLYLAKKLANLHFELDLGQGQYKRIKFSNIIEPDSIVNLKLTKTKKQITYEYFSDEKIYSSGAFELTNVFEGVKNVHI